MPARNSAPTPPRPFPPGKALEKLIAHLGTTQEKLATAMKVSRFTVNQIVRGRRNVTAEMAVRLAHVSGTTEDFWLDLQRGVDLHEARQELAATLEELEVLQLAGGDFERHLLPQSDLPRASPETMIGSSEGDHK